MSDAARVVLQWSPAQGRPRTCRFKTECAVGRAPDNRIIVPDADVSRHHALFTVRHGRLLLQNLSRGGVVRVRNETLPPAEVTRVHAGDVVTVGSVHMTIIELNTAAAPSILRCVNSTCNRTLTAGIRDCPWCGTSTAFADTQAG